MSDIIQLLPDSVANQIAAGEVIQRPASVIKELVENAVDAGARNIRVLVVDAGRTSIQVIDDGCGMSETDARLAFERHATSKIRQADDLFSLHTMGFRGEALPSIAAVAQVELTTRMATDELGTRLSLQGTRVMGQEPVACPVGSNFKVENLFFNVPARRKFLKSNTTELNNIVAAFERIVLVYPGISFTLYSNGQELLVLRAGSLRQRISDVFGHKLSQELLPVEVDTALCRISGFVGKPEIAHKKGSHTYFFVNGRYMKHPYFHRAVVSAYDRLLPEGMVAPYFIYFDVEPADIDVNIHPTKTEIKFENEQGIYQILTATVKDALGRFCEVPAIDFDTEGRPDIPVFDPRRDAVQMPHVSYNPAYNPFGGTTSPSLANGSTGNGQLAPASAGIPADGLTAAPISGGSADGTTPPDDLFPETFVPAASNILTDKSPQHYQYKGRYVMTAVKSGLMVIDQQRADIRIRYERYMNQLSRKSAATQRLLFPEMLQFSPSDDVVMQRMMPALANMGFDISSLGGATYALAGIPADAEGTDPLALVRNIVADAAFGIGNAQPADDLRSAMALSMARHTAIEQGQVLGNDDMERLVNELFACSNVNYTPDGQTILAILPQTDIEKLLP
ncbi:MAG: DNA mismatch repair endonuclease MutL [Prevotella sp.]|nr:DNA mismatch repair endonuclease MutL [Prevotella sp.]